jgi:hypothetical protein
MVALRSRHRRGGRIDVADDVPHASVELDWSGDTMQARWLRSGRVGSWRDTGLTRDEVSLMLADAAEGPVRSGELGVLAQVFAESAPLRALLLATEDGGSARLAVQSDKPDLLGLPWERVPAPVRVGGVVEGGEAACPLDRHPQLTLLRHVAGDDEDDRDDETDRRQRTWGSIVVADAVSVTALPTESGERDLGKLPPWGSREVELVRRALGPHAVDVVDACDPACTETALREALGGEAFAFVFGGHHVDGGIVLAQPDDATRGVLLAADDLGRQLMAAGVVIAVLVACAGAAPGGGRGRAAVDPSTAQRLVAAGVPFVIAMRDDVVDGVARQFVFAFFRLLGQRRPLDQALSQAAREAEAGTQAICSAQLYTSWLHEVYDLADPPAPSSIAGLAAYQVPAGWRPALGPCPVTDDHRVDLGTQLCLDRRPRTAVVCGPPGRSLADALNDIERQSVRLALHELRAVAQVVVPPRRWVEIEAKGEPPLGPDDLRRRLPTDAFDGTRGYVLRRLDPADAGRWHGRLRAAAPGCAIVVAVEAPQAMDAIALAAEIGDALGAKDTRVDVMTRVRPGDEAGSGELRAPIGTDEAVLAGLEALVAVERRRRGLDAGASPVPVPPLPRDLDPALVAAAIVRARNAAAPEGGPAVEAATIVEVRDWAPWYYRPLLARHAAERTGPARYASLSAAAAFDADVDAWLDAAPPPRNPGDVPLALRDARLLSAVLLGSRRRGRPLDDEQAWLAYAEGSAAAVAVARPGAGPPSAVAELVASVDVAVAASRAGLTDDLRAPDLPTPAGSRGWWALVGRSALVEDTARWLGGLPLAARATAGLLGADETFDHVLAELAADMGNAFRPPVPPTPLPPQEGP